MDEQRITELKHMPYENYLDTPEWQERRAQALERAGSRCQVCYSGEDLNVHHRTYERRGHEEPADLTVLCQPCHAWHHRRMNAHASLLHVADGLKEVEAKLEAPDDSLVPTGFEDLDRILGRLQKGQFALVGGRSHHGTLPLLMHIGLNAAKAKKTVAFFSLTLNKELWTEQLLKCEAGLTFQLQRGPQTDENWESLLSAMEVLEGLPYWIGDASRTIEDIEQHIEERLTGNGAVDLVIVDSIELLETGKKEYPDQRVNAISRALKLLARKFNIPVVAACQISPVNSSGIKYPQLSDVRHAEPYADSVLLLYLDELYNPDSERRHLLDILIAKNQLGPVGEVSLYYHAELSRMQDLEVHPPIEP